MSERKNHITKITPEIIDKYQKDLLSEEEQYQVERLMLSSPFEREAEEGFADHQTNLLSDLEILNNKLENRINEEKNDTQFLWLKIAASVLILFLTAYLVWDLSNSPVIPEPLSLETSEENSDLEEVVKEEILEVDSTTNNQEQLLAIAEVPNEEEMSETLEPIPSTPLKASETTSGDNEKTGSDPIADMPVIEEDLIADNSPIEINTAAKVEDENEVAETLDVLEDLIIEESAQALPMLKKETIQSRSSSGLASRKKSKADDTRIQGQITSAEDGTPLPGVNVVLKGTTQGTVTDMNGNFQLDGLEIDKNLLVVSFIGLETKEVEIDNDSPMNIALENDRSELSEVVVTGYGISPIEPNYIKANPIDGMRAYKKYLNEGIDYSRVNSVKRGRVIVTFDIEIDGSLSNIMVEKSLGEWEDKEAIRLIEEGAKWRPAEKSGTKIKSSARVVIKFKKK